MKETGGEGAVTHLNVQLVARRSGRVEASVSKGWLAIRRLAATEIGPRQGSRLPIGRQLEGSTESEISCRWESDASKSMKCREAEGESDLGDHFATSKQKTNALLARQVAIAERQYPLGWIHYKYIQARTLPFTSSHFTRIVQLQLPAAKVPAALLHSHFEVTLPNRRPPPDSDIRCTGNLS